MHAAKKQTVERLVNDVERGQRQQPGLDERGEILILSMAIGMPLIGRLIRHANREKGNDGRNQVQTGVQRFGKHAEASGPHHQKSLQRNQKCGRAYA